LIIYPAIMRQIGRYWRQPTDELADEAKESAVLWP